MGKFDGILICSDWDGTLCKGLELPFENVKSVRYFQENGGIFTVCTGRFYPYIEAFSDRITPNTYLISLNGACIIDLKSREKLYEGFLPKDFFGVFDTVMKSGVEFEGVNFFERGLQESFFVSYGKLLKNKEKLRTKTYYKAVIVAKCEHDAIYIKNLINLHAPEGILSVRSWQTGVEIISCENTKDKAVLRLKKALMARRLVCVGDFENDISMLRVADLSYAVCDAVDEAKAVATKIVPSVTRGSIAAVIRDLEEALT